MLTGLSLASHLCSYPWFYASQMNSNFSIIPLQNNMQFSQTWEHQCYSSCDVLRSHSLNPLYYYGIHSSGLWRRASKFSIAIIVQLRDHFRNCWKVGYFVVTMLQLPCSTPRNNPFQLLNIWFGTLVWWIFS